jgi:hypothetical protein
MPICKMLSRAVTAPKSSGIKIRAAARLKTYAAAFIVT